VVTTVELIGHKPVAALVGGSNQADRRPLMASLPAPTCSAGF